MKIGFLHKPNDIYTISRIKFFISRGHKVYSITFPNRKIAQKKIDKCIQISLPNIFLNEIFTLKRLVYLWHIRKITKLKKLDIFHVVNAESLVLATFSKSQITIVENQGSDVLVAPNKYPILKYIYKIFYKKIDGVIQDSFVAQAAGIKYGANKKNNEVIEIGIDFSVFNKNLRKDVARNSLGINKSDPIIFSSRSIAPIYNIDIIIKSIPEVKYYFPNARFIFAANSGSFSDEIVKFINDNELSENILFTGFLNHSKDMPYYYTDADVVVSIPSSDSSPFSVYEAMATKTPVIATKLPWMNGKFKAGLHILTVPIRDENALSNAIIKVLSNDIKIDLDLAYNFVYENINVDKANKILEKFYVKLLNGQKSS